MTVMPQPHPSRPTDDPRPLGYRLAQRAASMPDCYPVYPGGWQTAPQAICREHNRPYAECETEFMPAD